MTDPFRISFLACILWNCVHISCPMIVEGTLSSKSDWAFLDRFCFDKDTQGKVFFEFEYPVTRCCQNILLYFDTQWPRVYPQEDKSCRYKEAQLIVENNQVINLTDRYAHSGCVRKTRHDGKEEYFSCTGDRKFSSSRARWWYMAVSNCQEKDGLLLHYKMELTNGDSFWKQHFSADEQFILETDIAMLVMFFVLFLLCCYVSGVLRKRRLFHFTYKMYVCSLVLEVISLCFMITYYTRYGLTGRPDQGIKVTGRGIHFTAHIVFLVMIILLAKGWTVTRGRISSSGQVKLGIFCTLYTICFIVLFIYEAAVFDKGKVLYIYESPAGAGICILRIIAWLWFCYGTFFTLKHYPSKNTFYYPFWFFYTTWFLSGPIMVLIANYIIDTWMREQIVNGIDWSISFLAHGLFLVITRPSAANTNFPFHLRTCQIGADVPGSQQASSGHSYEPQTYIGPPSTNMQNVTSMFLASDVSANKPTSDPGMVNGNHTGVSNGAVAQSNMGYPMAQLSLSTLPSAPPAFDSAPPAFSSAPPPYYSD